MLEFQILLKPETAYRNQAVRCTSVLCNIRPGCWHPLSVNSWCAVYKLSNGISSAHCQPSNSLYKSAPRLRRNVHGFPMRSSRQDLGVTGKSRVRELAAPQHIHIHRHAAYVRPRETTSTQIAVQVQCCYAIATLRVCRRLCDSSRRPRIYSYNSTPR